MARINPELREPTYENVVVGELIGPLRVVADEDYRRRACFALGESAGLYAPGKTSFVPAAMIGRDLVALFCSVYDPSRVVGIHQKEEIWFHAPIPLGTVMEYTGRYTDKYEKRGKGYTVFDSEARDAATGRLLVHQISTEIMRVPSGIRLGTGEGAKEPGSQRIDPVWPADREPLAHATVALAKGTPVLPLLKRAHQDQMAVFSGVNTQWYNIHTDVEIALKAGFRDTIAQGMMETCWMAEALANFVGSAWHRSGWIKMIFIRPVFRGDAITCRAVVVDVEPTGAEPLLKFEVWTENQDGERTAVGQASSRFA
jgi:acyl dehydratase